MISRYVMNVLEYNNILLGTVHPHKLVCSQPCIQGDSPSVILNVAIVFQNIDTLKCF